VADLGDAYCEQLRRTAIGPFEVAAAGAPDALDGLVGLGAGLRAFLPWRELETASARAVAHGQTIEGEAGGPLVLADDDGPIAIAEPSPGGGLRPVVGFRG
jgi:tRNA pseudouridine55 synthase